MDVGGKTFDAGVYPDEGIPKSDGVDGWRSVVFGADGSGDRVVTPSRHRSSTSDSSLSTPGLEAKLRSRRMALRLLEEREYQRQLLEEGEIVEPLGDFQGLEWDLASPIYRGGSLVSFCHQKGC
ncbi:hypothetical protein NDU88_000277 [Pleurodeles waltl]|uniref:Uncharacterized protein n=1 Tax=Pleurodeles waltl TaxID=8319 RepID=A0AAV7L7M7_PLEWA|nr:hypothetical protein NDU88_000277 [Pleurodeles waltl]